MRWNRHSRNLSPRKLLRNVYRYEKIILKFTIKDWTVLLSQIFCLCVFRSQNPILIIFREREIWKTYFPLNQVKITGSYFNSSGVLVRKDSSIGPSQKTSHVTELGITNPIKKNFSRNWVLCFDFDLLVFSIVRTYISDVRVIQSVIFNCEFPSRLIQITRKFQEPHLKKQSVHRATAPEKVI